MAPRPSGDGPIVLAFGGNALLPDPFHPEEQEGRARELARSVRLLSRWGRGIVLVHGNGPQVGMILLRVEATRADLPGESLDVLVAETQGSIGTLLARTLHNALVEERPRVAVTPILTQVVVDPDDPAFRAPDKPIGPTYDDDAAARLRAERGWTMVRERRRGWRRTVASPRPRDVVELDSIAAVARAGHVVVAGGGGGVPVVRDGAGRLIGVEAVIDKDRTAALLARALDAPELLILTGAPCVALDFGTPQERPLPSIGAREALERVADGTFPAGSMGPKVEAAAEYVLATGRTALITDHEHLALALAGRAGTRVVPE